MKYRIKRFWWMYTLEIMCVCHVCDTLCVCVCVCVHSPFAFAILYKALVALHVNDERGEDELHRFYMTHIFIPCLHASYEPRVCWPNVHEFKCARPSVSGWTRCGCWSERVGIGCFNIVSWYVVMCGRLSEQNIWIYSCIMCGILMWFRYVKISIRGASCVSSS